MITDSQTNFVFIADTLSAKYPEFAKEFVSKLEQAKIPFDVLPKTKDVWAVDYMPIQVSENKFVRFTYKPDYLISTKKNGQGQFQTLIQFVIQLAFKL